jgi:hypothetical protein
VERRLGRKLEQAVDGVKRCLEKVGKKVDILERKVDTYTAKTNARFDRVEEWLDRHDREGSFASYTASCITRNQPAVLKHSTT